LREADIEHFVLGPREVVAPEGDCGEDAQADDRERYQPARSKSEQAVSEPLDLIPQCHAIPQLTKAILPWGLFNKNLAWDIRLEDMRLETGRAFMGRGQILSWLTGRAT
jgi:hypothetical protein